MRRINIIGTTGSGKSTLAEKIATKLSIPYVEMDALSWGKNWQSLSDELFLKKLEDCLKKESWVLDGNYNRTTPIKWKNVEIVIWLDLPFWKIFYQVVIRTIHRSWTKKELWPGTNNRETFRKSFFSKDSVIVWCLKMHARTKKRYEACSNDPQYAHIKFIRFKSHKEADQFLNSLSAT